MDQITKQQSPGLADPSIILLGTLPLVMNICIQLSFGSILQYFKKFAYSIFLCSKNSCTFWVEAALFNTLILRLFGQCKTFGQVYASVKRTNFISLNGSIFLNGFESQMDHLNTESSMHCQLYSYLHKLIEINEKLAHIVKRYYKWVQCSCLQ